MNAAEKARMAKNKEEERHILDWYHEAQYYHSDYLAAQKRFSVSFKNKILLKKAIRLYVKCAKLGHADSMECLAFIYQDCLVVKNKKKAFKWYKMGAEHGNTTCMHNLGVCYQDGEGVRMSYTQAQYWFEQEEKAKK